MKRISLPAQAPPVSVTPNPNGMFHNGLWIVPNWRGLRNFVRRHRRLLKITRMLSAVFWLGPWRNWAIRYFQWRAANPPLPRAETSCFNHTTALDAQKLAAQLETDGFASGLQLPETMVEEVLAYCTAHPLNHHRNPHLTCPAIHRLAFDPALLDVITTYLGAEPLLYATQVYWTYPPASEEKSRLLRQRKARFHYDIGDFKALSVFFYLTDVDAECGPHMLIRNTQHSKSWRQLLTRYLNDEEATDLYGDRIVTLMGPRGSGFMVNLACYHKHAFGTRTRLMLGLTYVLQRAPEMPPSASQTSA
jgi:hypothetical protein